MKVNLKSGKKLLFKIIWNPVIIHLKENSDRVKLTRFKFY